MEFAILQQPSEGTYKVKVDGEFIDGFIKKNPHNNRFSITHVNADGEKVQLKTEPHSREGAACLLMYQTFERERKRLEAREGAVNADS